MVLILQYAMQSLMAIFFIKTIFMQKMKNLVVIILLAIGLAECKPNADVKIASTSSTAPAVELTRADVTIITNKELASWEFAKTKQLDKLRDVLAEDYQAFFGQIVMNKGEVLQSFQKSNIKAYRLSNIRVKKLADNVAVIYYEALQDATDPEGERWVPQIGASNVYVKRANTWYALFYHESPLAR